MKSLEAIKMSKLNKKNLGSANLVGEQEVPSTEQAPAGMQLPSTNKVGSMDVIKTAKATDVGKLQTVNSVDGQDLNSIDQLESQPFLKTKKVPYSPIKSYMRKGK